MENEVIAQRYAQAITALDKANLPQIEEQLHSIANAFSKDVKISNFFYSPRVDGNAKKQALVKSLGSDVDPLVKNLLFLLIDKRREVILTPLAFEVSKVVAQKQGKVTANLTIAKELNANEKQEIQDQLATTLKNNKKKFGITSSKEIEFQINHNVNPDILGGLVVKVGDYLWDASAKKTLNDWKKNVKSNKISLSKQIQES